MATHARAHRRYQLTQLSVAVALVFPAAAQAQADAQAKPPAPAAAAGTAVLPQITINAQRLEDNTGSYTAGKTKTATPLTMSLRDTPQSVSVVTQQRIEDQGLVTVSDVVNNVTGVSVNQYETHRAGFTARGFDIDNLQIDGIPTTWDQPWSGGEVTGSLAIYDRVEVVRGATGLMTGAGNPSAAINLVRKRASSKQMEGSVELGIGSWDQRRAMADVATPLNATGSIRARVVGEYQKSNSWVNLLKNDSQTLYGTIEADLTPNTLLSAGASRQETDPNGPMWGGLPYWYTDGSLTNWDVSKTSAAGWTRWQTGYTNQFVNLEHRFGNGWSVKAAYTRGERDSDSHLLYLSGVPDRVTGAGMSAFSGSYKTDTTQTDIGLHAGGPFELAGRKHEAAFGYMHSKQTFNSDSRSADFETVSSDVGNFNQWNGAAYPEPAWSAPTFYEGSTTRQEALYGVARISLADPLKLILGARVTNYEKSGRGLYTPAYVQKHDREVTPYAGLVYDINDTYSAYVSYTDIFQPQNRKDFNGAMLDPVVGKSAETGIKGEFFDGRLNTSFSVFRIKQDGLAQEVDTVDRDGAGPLVEEPYYRAAPGARSTGFEAEVAGELAQGWNASLGYTQYDAEDATGMDVNSIYPRKLFKVFTTYRLPGQWSGLTVGGGVNWEDRTYTVDPSAPAGNTSGGRIEQKAYSLVNLMARYEFSKQLSAQLNINNVLDEKSFGMFAAYGAITYRAPRNASLTLKYRF